MCLSESSIGIRQLSYGQPVPQTHPELLRPGELAVGVAAEEFAARRRRLSALMLPGSIAVLPAATVTYMAGIVPYPYRPDPDFLYLTGLAQRGVVALEASRATSAGAGSAGCVEPRMVVFLEAPDPDADRWDGVRIDKACAAELLGAHQVHYMHELPRVLGSMLAQVLGEPRARGPGCGRGGGESGGAVYFDVDRANGVLQQTLATVVARAAERATPAPATSTAAAGAMAAPPPLLPLRPLLHELRAVKSASEVALMRASAEAAADALAHVVAGTEPGVGEWQLSAAFEYHCKAAFGAQRMAYPPVVAGGRDAYFTHYGRNDKVLRDGQLLLMDAGCERHGYVSDVTRTWPVNGTFTAPQAEVYDIVLSVHAACVRAARPGASIRQLHALSTRMLSEGIKELGLCGPSATLEDIAMTRYRDFYWHSVGHWLGMDVHDTHLLGHGRELEPGHVITVEPGLYIPDEPRYGRYAGIGVRIEDDVLVTRDGCDVLSAGVPTARRELETLVGSRPLGLPKA